MKFLKSLTGGLRRVFARPHYQSDTTLFIEQLKAQDPQLAERQRQGRALLWDKTLNAQTQQDFRAAQVAQQPYVYQTRPDA